MLEEEMFRKYCNDEYLHFDLKNEFQLHHLRLKDKVENDFLFDVVIRSFHLVQLLIDEHRKNVTNVLVNDVLHNVWNSMLNESVENEVDHCNDDNSNSLIHRQYSNVDDDHRNSIEANRKVSTNKFSVMKIFQ